MHGYSVIACLASKARVVRVSSSDLEAEIRQYGSVLRVRGKLQKKIWTNKNFKQIRTKFANKNFRKMTKDQGIYSKRIEPKIMLYIMQMKIEKN